MAIVDTLLINCVPHCQKIKMQHGDVPMVNVNLAALKPWKDNKNHRASSRFKHDGLYNGGVKLSWVNQDMPGPPAVRIKPPPLRAGCLQGMRHGLEPLPHLPLKDPGVNAGVSSHGINDRRSYIGEGHEHVR
ncbi:MAG: hypothetical protein HY711_10615 [Candidatus Melainabacteria bacterium]|nr:hypothetical protein [Candidatus Melainabacteria bacterium]